MLTTTISVRRVARVTITSSSEQNPKTPGILSREGVPSRTDLTRIEMASHWRQSVFRFKRGDTTLAATSPTHENAIRRRGAGSSPDTGQDGPGRGSGGTGDPRFAPNAADVAAVRDRGETPSGPTPGLRRRENTHTTVLSALTDTPLALGRGSKAAGEYARALDQAGTAQERRWIEGRIEGLDAEGRKHDSPTRSAPPDTTG
jgi:hypothetical protein